MVRIALAAESDRKPKISMSLVLTSLIWILFNSDLELVPVSFLSEFFSASGQNSLKSDTYLSPHSNDNIKKYNQDKKSKSEVVSLFWYRCLLSDLG